jgi:hypothetical protein
MFLRTLPVVSLHAYLENVKGEVAGVHTVKAKLNTTSVTSDCVPERAALRVD